MLRSPLLLLALVGISLPAHAGFCEWFLSSNTLARPASSFSVKILKKYEELSAPKLSQNHTSSAKGAEIEQRLLDLAKELAESSKIDQYLANPHAFTIVFVESGNTHTPDASMRFGRLRINDSMLGIVENDDELAAVIGHELLHHTLAHDLVMLQLTQRSWMKWLGKRHAADGSLPFMKFGSFLGDLFEVMHGRAYDAHEKEVDRALPVLLMNAGFDPWAAVSLYSKLLALKNRYPMLFPDNPTYEKCFKRNEAFKESLLLKNIQPKQIHEDHRVRGLLL